MKRYGCFAGLDKRFTRWDTSKIAILPIPYDKTSTWIKGADKGPAALIGASPALEYYEIETQTEVYRRGIYTCEPLRPSASPEKMVREVEVRVSELLDKSKFTVALGGEHSISIGCVKAQTARNKDLCVLQLDAHTDLREEYGGSSYNHACVMARIKELCPVIHVGIRSMCVEEKVGLDEDNVFYAKDIVHKNDWMEKVVEKLLPNVYVSIDLDVFDPSIMPSTGTPEPGGLDWYQVTGLLKAVAAQKNVIGFDIVELCPNPDNKAPDFLAAKLVYQFLSYVYKYKCG